MNKKQVSVIWSYIAVVLIAVTVALCVALYTVIHTKVNLAREEYAKATEAVTETAAETADALAEETEALPEEENSDISGPGMLDLWENSSPLKQQLVSYVERVTDENSSSFIPIERRIAVFDLDGTLFCETDPTYFVQSMTIHHILDDEGYRDRASKFEKKTAEKLLKLLEEGKETSELETDSRKCFASSFSDITAEELYEYIQAFKTLPAPGYDGMMRGDAFYKPMVQVVDYLEANDFTIYIVSGTDRSVVRGLIHGSPLKISDSHIIGSSRSVRASGQGEKDASSYIFTGEDRIISANENSEIINQMNKVVAIEREIGMKPVLSFGNSTGDASMLEYVITGNPYESMSFALCCDDLERENGNPEKAEKMREMCSENNWIPISMKDDWATIYGDGVSKK